MEARGNNDVTGLRDILVQSGCWAALRSPASISTIREPLQALHLRMQRYIESKDAGCFGPLAVLVPPFRQGRPAPIAISHHPRMPEIGLVASKRRAGERERRFLCPTAVHPKAMRLDFGLHDVQILPCVHSFTVRLSVRGW